MSWSDELVCAFCLGSLQVDPSSHLSCPRCGCRFSIQDEVPVMILERATRICPVCGFVSHEGTLAWHDRPRCPGCGRDFKIQDVDSEQHHRG